MNPNELVLTKIDEGGDYTAHRDCPQCGEMTLATIRGGDLFKWHQGDSAQSCFPYLNDAVREALFVTGICGECWDQMMGASA